MRDGQQQFNEGLERVIECIVAVETEHAKVDVVSAKHGFQHGEADGNPFQLQRVDLFLRHFTQSQDPVPCTREKSRTVYISFFRIFIIQIENTYTPSKVIIMDV